MWRVVALTSVLALVAAGCGGGPSPQPDSTPGTLPSRPAATAPSGPAEPFATDAALVLGLAGEPGNWNPLAAPPLTDPARAAVVDAVLPSAFVTAPDQTVGRNAALVTSVTETPSRIVYEINSRAVWSDGVPITAADFEYTWQAQSGRSRYRDTGGRAFTPAATAGYRQISSVTTGGRDPNRVVVRLASPDADWESLFDPILPAHVGRAVGFDRGFTDPVTSLVSGGPFLVQSYEPGHDVVLVRNPRWWGPAANLAELDVTFVASASEATEGLEQAQLGAAVTAFDPATVAALESTAGLTVSVTNDTSFDDLVLDGRSGPLAVRAVRLALMLAVDRRSVAGGAARDGDPAATPVRNRAFPTGSTAYRDETGVLGDAATAAGRAGQLLVAAGYTTSRSAVTGRSTLSRHGRAVRLTLAVRTTSPFAGREVTAIVDACRALGIAVAVGGAPPSPGSPRRGSHRDSMALVEVPLSSSPAVLAATYASGGAANRSGYSSTVMDGLLTRLAAATTSTERDEIADQVDAQAWSDAVDLPLLGVPRVLAYQSRYVDLTAAATVSGVNGDVARWGISEST